MQNLKEITTPLRSPLSGWKKPKPFTEPKPKPVKEKFDDPLVHELLQYLRDAIGAELDGLFGANYAACKELIRRCNAKGNDPKQVLITLVDVALKDPFHGKNITTWRYLLNHAVSIFKSHAERFAKPKSKLAETLLQADERFLRNTGYTRPHPDSRNEARSVWTADDAQ